MILAAARRIPPVPGSDSRTALRGTQDYLRRKEYAKALGHELLKRLGGFAAGVSGDAPVSLRHDAAGRPFLCAGDAVLFEPGFCSLSHSGDALLAVVADVPVGCDTERVLRPDCPLRALEGFFSEADLQYLRERKGCALALTRLWTRKEAVCKLAGRLPRGELHLSDAGRTREALGISFAERVHENQYVSTIAARASEAAVEWVDF